MKKEIRTLLLNLSHYLFVADVSTTKSHTVFVVIPVLLVLLLIGFLYRQYLIQKR